MGTELQTSEKGEFKGILRLLATVPAGILSAVFVIMAIQHPITHVVLPDLLGDYWPNSFIYFLVHAVFEIVVVYAYYFVGVKVAPEKQEGLQILSLVMIFYFAQNFNRTIGFWFNEDTWVALASTAGTLIQLVYALGVLYHVASNRIDKIAKVIRFFKGNASDISSTI